jgi:hypothetical protein
MTFFYLKVLSLSCHLLKLSFSQTFFLFNLRTLICQNDIIVKKIKPDLKRTEKLLQVQNQEKNELFFPLGQNK